MEKCIQCDGTGLDGKANVSVCKFCAGTGKMVTTEVTGTEYKIETTEPTESFLEEKYLKNYRYLFPIIAILQITGMTQK